MEIETDNGPMTISYVNIKNAGEVDGTLLSEVSKGKDGVKVKLADRMKAIQWISDHMDLSLIHICGNSKRGGTNK